MGWKIIQLVFGAQDVTIDFVPFGHAGLRISSRAKLRRTLHKPQPRARSTGANSPDAFACCKIIMYVMLPR